MRTSRFLAALGGVVAAASLSACSLSAPKAEPVFQAPAEPTPTASADSGIAAGGEAPPATGSPQVLRIAQLGGFSPVLVNGKGRTIYRFDRDSNDPPTTTCVEACLKTWQPVLAPNGVEVDAGIEEDLVGTVTRPDGDEQVTLNGWPMYYFHKDLSLGQTAGHGTADAWFAISPAGGRAEKTSDDPAPAKKPQVLRVAEVDGLSPAIVVNAKGRTIYRFEKDDNNPPRTACAGDCLKTWQPVLAPNGVQVGEGIDQDLVGVITRPDGSEQLTLKGWPMYYFHKDLSLGQIAGHGAKDQWFAITAGGGKAKRKSTSSGGSNTGSSY
jgi:predicted lipoprotein with Yx(FWY)xxD motif